jgi:hypothetical protein
MRYKNKINPIIKADYEKTAILTVGLRASTATFLALFSSRLRINLHFDPEDPTFL